MIILLLCIPLLGCLFCLPYTDHDPSDRNKMKNIALFFSVLNFLVSICLWISFDSSIKGYQFLWHFEEISFCHLHMGIDGTSLYFVLLTTFLTPICLLSNWIDITSKIKYFLISFLILETLQIACFVVLDLLVFYIFFESVLIPLFLVVLFWGASDNKIRAAFLLFLYTLFGSLFMLLAIMTISYYVGSSDFQVLSLTEISLDMQKWLWLAFFLAFAIKTPLWPLNTWLIKAHVEAPLAGSIILAGTILKLATYGYIRVVISILPDASNYFMPLIQGLSIISLVYASLATLRQSDTKAVIAYSSVAHMAVVILGLFSNTIQGLEGAILLSLAHGLVSPALFIICGGIIYVRSHSRVILYHKGLATYMPILSIFFLIFTLFNTAIPLSLNFSGEIMSLMGTWFRSPLASVLGATGIVLSACYSIYFYNRLCYGKYSPFLQPLPDLDRREFILLLTLFLPTLLLGIVPSLILNSLHSSISQIIYLV